MNGMLQEYIKAESMPETAFLVSGRSDTVNAAAFFTRASRIDVAEEQFFAYFVYWSNLRYILCEAGQGPFSLLAVMDELTRRGVKTFMYINRAYYPSGRDKNIYLLSQSRLLNLKQSVACKTGLFMKMKKDKNFIAGKNITLDLKILFFNKKPASKKALSSGNTVTLNDYFFLSYLKHHSLDGISMNYSGENLINALAAVSRYLS